MSYKVLIPQDVMEVGKKYLRDRGYEIKMGTGVSVGAIIDDVRDCDAILARTAPFPAEVLESGKSLKVIGRHGVGVDNIDVKRAEELGIWVTNAPESNSNTVAEHTILLILAVARKLPVVLRSFSQGDFAVRNREIGSDASGKTLGLIGLGRIGRLVVPKALGFGMSVVAYDPIVSQSSIPDGVEMVSREDLFTRADYVSLHIPATVETKGAVGAREFALMKRSAVLINAARGEVVDEEALVTALREGQIGGAGLDVFATEPPAVDNPLLSLPNVVVTPHNASHTIESMERMAIHAAMGIDDVLQGKKPQWPVNNPKKRG